MCCVNYFSVTQNIFFVTKLLLTCNIIFVSHVKFFWVDTKNFDSGSKNFGLDPKFCPGPEILIVGVKILIWVRKFFSGGVQFFDPGGSNFWSGGVHFFDPGGSKILVRGVKIRILAKKWENGQNREKTRFFTFFVIFRIFGKSCFFGIRG